MPKRSPRGFTLIELVVAVAVIGIVAALMSFSLGRIRTRSALSTALTDVQGLLHSARQTALASGHDVIVMIFPVRDGGGPRLVVYEDPTFDFMLDTGAINFAGYDPDDPASPGESSRAFEILDLPPALEVGPPTGMGAGATLPQPLSEIPVDIACSFCSPGDPNRRGAIRFDAQGSVTFYAENGVKRPSGAGASFTLRNSELGSRATFVILTTTGAVQVETEG